VNIGFIGTGNMGRILIEAFVESKAVNPNQLVITNRTIKKAIDIQKLYPEITVVSNGEEVVKRAELIFVCIKPLDIHPLLEHLSSHLTTQHCIVSITSPITVEQLESLVPCQVARVIPSINNRALSGSSLLTFGNSCSQHFKNYIERIFAQISNLFYIDEKITRIASDISSCGPAFFSYLLQRFIDAAVRKTNITKEQATILTSEMIIGLGELLKKELYTLPSLQEKVCVKGGITGEGIKVLESELGDLFEHIFEKTHEKFYEDIEQIERQFNNNIQ
jgi:competence protein ComER